MFIEGDVSGGTAVAGVVTSFWILKTYGVEAELTWASNRIAREYEGWFISYTEDPNATREEIERLASIARRSLGYVPGLIAHLPGSNGIDGMNQHDDVQRQVVTNPERQDQFNGHDPS